ncbi:MAG: D-aminoacyl-tRNA deacylase [Chloroflexota bacterium]|nr:D-aminoacyl-tRNA deacylase [Chloroflexota bacterium]
MRALIQRVISSDVRVGDEIIGAIDQGMTVFLGVGDADTAEDAQIIARKIATLRIFEDDAGKINRAIGEVGGAILLISQFTLYADCRKGRRPSFVHAALPAIAEPLVEQVITALRAQGVPVETGRFGAEMRVTIVNDGPLTIWLDSAELRSGSS